MVLQAESQRIIVPSSLYFSAKLPIKRKDQICSRILIWLKNMQSEKLFFIFWDFIPLPVTGKNEKN